MSMHRQPAAPRRGTAELLLATVTVYLSVVVVPSTHAAEALRSPSWLGDKRNLLPQVPADAVATMKEAWPMLALEITEDRTPPPEPFWQAARRVLELGEQAGLALVWMYAEDVPLNKSDWQTAARQRARLLSALDRDVVASKWLLPILRAKIDWVRENMAAGQLNKTPFTLDDLDSIKGYLIVQGSPSDLENVDRLTEELRQSDAEWARNMWPLLGTPEERAAADAQRRAQARTTLIPFYQRYKWCEKRLGPVKSAGATNVNYPAPNLPDAQRSPRASHSEATTSESSQTTSRLWIAWLLAIVAALGGTVWLVARKSSK